jgi:hypothetical protein
MRSHSGFTLRVFACTVATATGLVGALGLAAPAAATDGAAVVRLTDNPQTVGSQPVAARESGSLGVPTDSDCSATLENLPTAQPDGSVHWDILASNVRSLSRFTLRAFACKVASAAQFVGSAVGLAEPASASDEGAVQLTYYQQMVGNQPLAALESSSPGVPTALAISDSSATVEYVPTAQPDGSVHWDVLVQGFERNSERVNAVYDMVFVLALPVAPSGAAAFTPLDSAIVPQVGTQTASVPLVYRGEQIALKRNVGLEKSLLPELVGDPTQGKLPSLAGTGYAYTLWDTIVQYDPGYGPTIQAWASFHYATDTTVSAPVASDPRMKAYLITWIPTLNSNIPPYAVRMALQAP